MQYHYLLLCILTFHDEPNQMSRENRETFQAVWTGWRARAGFVCKRRASYQRGSLARGPPAVKRLDV